MGTAAVRSRMDGHTRIHHNRFMAGHKPVVVYPCVAIHAAAHSSSAHTIRVSIPRPASKAMSLLRVLLSVVGNCINVGGPDCSSVCTCGSHWLCHSGAVGWNIGVMAQSLLVPCVSTSAAGSVWSQFGAVHSGMSLGMSTWSQCCMRLRSCAPIMCMRSCGTALVACIYTTHVMHDLQIVFIHHST